MRTRIIYTVAEYVALPLGAVFVLPNDNSSGRVRKPDDREIPSELLEYDDFPLGRLTPADLLSRHGKYPWIADDDPFTGPKDYDQGA